MTRLKHNASTLYQNTLLKRTIKAQYSYPQLKTHDENTTLEHNTKTQHQTTTPKHDTSTQH